MAINHVHQYSNTITVPREALLENVVYNRDLSKKDLRVFLLLLTKLNGVSEEKAREYAIAIEIGDDYDESEASKHDVWIPLSAKQIAKDLHMDKEDVKESIERLVDENILQVGTSKTVKNGYRFSF